MWRDLSFSSTLQTKREVVSRQSVLPHRSHEDAQEVGFNLGNQ
jgi:hypothetical protein